jgi:hypothetical protein
MTDLTPIRIYRRDTEISKEQLQQLQTMVGRGAGVISINTPHRFGSDPQYWVVIFNWHFVEESRKLMIDQVIDPAAGRYQYDVNLQSWIRSHIKDFDKIIAYTTDDDFKSKLISEKQIWREILSRVKKFEKTVSESII